MLLHERGEQQERKGADDALGQSLRLRARNVTYDGDDRTVGNVVASIKIDDVPSLERLAGALV